RVFNAEGSKKFNALLTQKQINYVRFRNNKDIVTGIPFGIPGVMAPYWHVGALGYFSADGHLSYGDGWKSIEEDSDLKQSFPTEVKDHDAFGYWNLISKAKSQALDPASVGCDSKPNEKPLLPFVENPADR
ncbi:MAG: hypothetical protein NTX25_05340, partial [Proteobacteria bacterium]|nr:hypothetical protein [Pseudomonadota bacterium]